MCLVGQVQGQPIPHLSVGEIRGGSGRSRDGSGPGGVCRVESPLYSRYRVLTAKYKAGSSDVKLGVGVGRLAHQVWHIL
jgi:hypothetical protein